jgi:hypothetical protein
MFATWLRKLRSQKQRKVHTSSAISSADQTNPVLMVNPVLLDQTMASSPSAHSHPRAADPEPPFGPHHNPAAQHHAAASQPRTAAAPPPPAATRATTAARPVTPAAAIAEPPP